MTTMVLAALMTATSVAVWLSARASVLRRRGLARAESGVGSGWRAAAAVALIVVCLVLVQADARWWLGGVVLAAISTIGLRLWRGRCRRRGAARRRRAVMEVCESLAAELRAGLPPIVALEQTAEVMPELAPAVAAARLGGDVPVVLRELARRPGAEALRSVAAGWEIAQRTGGTLAAVLERVVGGIRDDESARREVESALGPPRATARLLAMLPLGGIGLGTSMGAAPLHVLLETPYGLACLALGISLALLGLLWVERLADAVA
jgi:tight adherence protein B